MKITKIETVVLEDYPNITFVGVHTDEGLVGWGDTYYMADAVRGYIHGFAAPMLLGHDPLAIELHWRRLYEVSAHIAGKGAEIRGLSAIDVALWDILGQAAGMPVWQLLGGAARDRIKTYNTCGGPTYGRPTRGRSGYGTDRDEPGKYEDLIGFMTNADELASDLLGEGITGMKIWPFDPFAEASNGTYISARDLDTALEPFRKIRAAVGGDMDIMVEFHSLWNLPTAMRIARALEEFEPFWFEDPLKADNIDALATFAAATHVPTTVSETLSTRWSFREVLERRAARVIMLDLSWVGGISEAKKIASMAEAYQLPVAPHDCTGPVVLQASTHLSLNAPNALIQETVRACYTGWYRELVTNLPVIADGYAALPALPGLGTELRPDIPDRPDATVRVSRG